MLNILELYLALVSKSCQMILCSGHCLKLSLLLLPLSSHAQNIKNIVSLDYSTYISPSQLWLQCIVNLNFLKSHFLFCFF